MFHVRSDRVISCCNRIVSTDHELIPARNVSLGSMHASASGINVSYYPTLKLPDVCSLAMNHYVSLLLTNRKSSVHLNALWTVPAQSSQFHGNLIYVCYNSKAVLI